MNPLGLVVDAAVRGSVLFVIAGIFVCVLRKRSAASRHLVWTAAITGQLALSLFLYLPVPGRMAWSVPALSLPSSGVLSSLDLSGSPSNQAIREFSSPHPVPSNGQVLLQVIWSGL